MSKFISKYPHIISPLFHEKIFLPGDKYSDPFCEILDISNLLYHYRHASGKKSIKSLDVSLFDWSEQDPLSLIFSIQYGSYPSPELIGIDYKDLIKNELDCPVVSIVQDAPISGEFANRRPAAFLSRCTLRPHYSIRTEFSHQGFYLGYANNPNDVINFWNLRACDFGVVFIDLDDTERFSEILPAWISRFEEYFSDTRASRTVNRISVWSLLNPEDEAFSMFKGHKTLHYQLSVESWNGLNIRSPMMYFDESSALGVVSNRYDNPQLTFSLTDKPFSDHPSFHTQHLVASLSFIGGLYDDDQHILVPPYIPELNEFCARQMGSYNEIKIEYERIGQVINATTSDCYISAIPVQPLI